jgi:hypothetical protein
LSIGGKEDNKTERNKYMKREKSWKQIEKESRRKRVGTPEINVASPYFPTNIIPPCVHDLTSSLLF